MGQDDRDGEALVGTRPQAPNAHTVSAVREGRFWTVTTSGVRAFKAAHTGNRGRPEGALTNSRGPHHTSPTQGANPPGAASMKHPTRLPAPAACTLGSRRFFNGLLRRHLGSSWAHPPLPRWHATSVPKLPDRRRLARYPGQLLNPGGRLRPRGRGVFPTVGFEPAAVLGQFTGRTRGVEPLSGAIPPVTYPWRERWKLAFEIPHRRRRSR